MPDITQELLDAYERLERIPRNKPREFFYPAYLVKQAAEIFKDLDWYINGYDGSRYYHGELVKEPSTKMDVTQLNEKIAAMELPDRMSLLTPAGRNDYLIGKWNNEEEDNHEN